MHTFEIVVHRGPIEGEYVLEGQSQLYVANALPKHLLIKALSAEDPGRRVLLRGSVHARRLAHYVARDALELFRSPCEAREAIVFQLKK